MTRRRARRAAASWCATARATSAPTAVKPAAAPDCGLIFLPQSAIRNRSHGFRDAGEVEIARLDCRDYRARAAFQPVPGSDCLAQRFHIAEDLDRAFVEPEIGHRHLDLSVLDKEQPVSS